MTNLKWIWSWVGIILLNNSVSAQFGDSIGINKQDLVMQFLPYHSGNLLSAAYLLEPAEFIKRADDFRAFARNEIIQEKDAQLRALKMKDVDFFYRNLLLVYKKNYGIDSVKQEEYYEISKSEQNKEIGDSRKVDAAFKAMKIKTLSVENSHLLDSLVFKGWEIDDSLLFKNSLSYRTAVSNKVSFFINNVYKKDYVAGNRYNILLKIVHEHIKDHFLKQYYQAAFTSNILRFPLDTAAREIAYHDFLEAVTDSTYRKQIKEIYDNYKAVVTMSEAPDFNYPDMSNKHISLKGLRGKYVYIDIWATWCTPCKAEIPYLEEIQELYKKKNIVFVSLSIDRLIDKEKWQSFVKEKQLGGIQLLADKDFESDFIKKFNINSIPRFILIDPQGKIVSANATRPFRPELKHQLDKLLL